MSAVSLRLSFTPSIKHKFYHIFTRSRHLIPRISYCFGNFAYTHSGKAQGRRLEVERKFLVTPAAVSFLRSNSGGSGLNICESLGNQTTHDIYYDRNGFLFSKGVYVRRRNGHWEAKVRAGGDFINSSFTEIDGNEAVKEIIKRNLIDASDGHNIEEMLEPCAAFVTERESWRIDGRFKVDIDTTDFGHIIGEVELTEALASIGGERAEGEGAEEHLKERMNQEIQAFMRLYPEVFPAGRPVGKLTAYFQSLDRRL